MQPESRSRGKDGLGGRLRRCCGERAIIRTLQGFLSGIGFIGGAVFATVGCDGGWRDLED